MVMETSSNGDSQLINIDELIKVYSYTDAILPKDENSKNYFETEFNLNFDDFFENKESVDQDAFVQLVKSIFNENEVYLSNNLEQILNIYHNSYEKIDPYIFIFTFGELLNSPLLLAKAFSLMILSENDLFVEFLNEPGAFEVFVDHFMPLIFMYDYNSNPDFIIARIGLIKAVTSLVADHYPQPSRIKKVLPKFFKLLIPLLNVTDQSTQIEALRAIMFLLKRPSTPITKVFRKKILTKMILVCYEDSPILPIATAFAIENKPSRFKLSSIYNELINTNDIQTTIIFLEAIESLAIASAKDDDDDPTDLLVFFMNLSIEDQIFGKAALEMFKNIVIVFCFDINVLNWVVFLIRKCIIMLALSEKANKFKRRRYMVEKLCLTFLNTDLPFIVYKIKSILFSLSQYGYCKDFINSLSIEDTIDLDHLTIRFLGSTEFEIMEDEDIKNFIHFPFEDMIDAALIDYV